MYPLLTHFDIPLFVFPNFCSPCIVSNTDIGDYRGHDLPGNDTGVDCGDHRRNDDLRVAVDAEPGSHLQYHHGSDAPQQRVDAASGGIGNP